MKTVFLTTCLMFTLVTQAITTSSCNAQSVQNELQLGLSYTLSLGGVCEQLKMDENQRYALDDLWLMTELGLKTEIQKFQNEYSEALPEVEKELIKSDFQNGVKKLRDNEKERIESVLSVDQVDRLKQIRFQCLRRQAGGMAGIKKELGLSEEQVARIADLKASTQKKIRTMMTENNKLKIPQADAIHNMGQLRQRFEEDIMGVLTSAQKQKLSQLEGEKYEFQYGPKKVVESADTSSENSKGEQPIK